MNIYKVMKIIDEVYAKRDDEEILAHILAAVELEIKRRWYDEGKCSVVLRDKNRCQEKSVNVEIRPWNKLKFDESDFFWFKTVLENLLYHEIYKKVFMSRHDLDKFDIKYLKCDEKENVFSFRVDYRYKKRVDYIRGKLVCVKELVKNDY